MSLSDEAWTTQELSRMSVLLVDDHEDSRGAIAEFLSFHGAEVTAVPSVAAALKAMAATSFDALVSDIRMPDATGYDLIQQVRGWPDSKGSIPAIAITAYAELEGRDEALAAGFDDYMPKMSSVRLVRALVALRDKRAGAPGA
jgi:CheY-like chemotaxis protein